MAEQSIYTLVTSEDTPAGQDSGSLDQASTKGVFKSEIQVKMQKGSLQMPTPQEPMLDNLW